MRLRFRMGKKGTLGRLTREHEAMLKRLEAGELTDEEAAAQLGGSVRTWQWSFGSDQHEKAAHPKPTSEPEPEQAAEDDAAKALVERIARDVDAE